MEINEVIDALLSELEFRCDEGIIDFKNRKQISLMSEILDEMGLGHIKSELISNITEGTDFTTTFSNNINAGTASLTITGIGNYIGSKTVEFNIINPEPITSNLILEYNSKTFTGGTSLIDLSGNSRTGTVNYTSSTFDGQFFTFSNPY